jgi:hypothetical protein
MTKIQQWAADVVQAGTAVGAVLAIVLNASNALSIPGKDIAIITIAAGIVNAIVGGARRYTVKKIAARSDLRLVK